MTVITKTIHELDALGAAPAIADAIPLWDDSAAATVQVTVDELTETIGTELLDTDATFAANSDVVAPSQKAAKTYIATVAAMKENTLTAGTTSQYYRGDKSWQTLDKTAVGLGNVDNTSDATKNAAAVTLTNHRITKRIGSTTSSGTPTINTDNVDQYNLTAQAAAITSFTTNLSGTPTDGQPLMIQIKDNGTARAITWGASFIASGVAALLTTTVISKTHRSFFVYDATAAKWVCMAVDATGY